MYNEKYEFKITTAMGSEKFEQLSTIQSEDGLTAPKVFCFVANALLGSGFQKESIDAILGENWENMDDIWEL